MSEKSKKDAERKAEGKEELTEDQLEAVAGGVSVAVNGVIKQPGDQFIHFKHQASVGDGALELPGDGSAKFQK